MNSRLCIFILTWENENEPPPILPSPSHTYYSTTIPFINFEIFKSRSFEYALSHKPFYILIE